MPRGIKTKQLWQNPGYRNYMIEIHKGQKTSLGKHWRLSEKAKKNIGEGHKGLNTWNKGKHCSEETKKRIKEGHLGKHHSEETKKKISESHKGEKSYFWKGGISFEPYSVDWTEDLKKAIRKRDKYTCQICGKEPAIIVHHIDYDKKNCNTNNLITLCHSCHNKTNLNRNYWINYFNEKEKFKL